MCGSVEKVVGIESNLKIVAVIHKKKIQGHNFKLYGKKQN